MKVLGLSLLLAASSAFGSVVITGPANYEYLLTLPTLSGGMEDGSSFQFEFTWRGPLRINSPDNSACPGYCGPIGSPGQPKPTEPWYNMSFTAGGPGNNDPEVIIRYSDNSGIDFASSNTATFTLIEPDSFWSTLGSQAFPANNAGPGGEGASFDIGGMDPGTGSATVNTSVIPEPSFAGVLGLGLAGLVAFVRRKRR